MGAVTSPLQCADLCLALAVLPAFQAWRASADAPRLLIIRFSPQLLHVWKANPAERGLDSRVSGEKIPPGLESDVQWPAVEARRGHTQG